MRWLLICACASARREVEISDTVEGLVLVELG
jgi:hypothetical protein